MAWEKKEEIWFSPMTKVLTLTENSKKQTDNTKNFDYTTLTDRLRTASWIDDSHLTGVIKPDYGIPTFKDVLGRPDVRVGVCPSR